MAPALVTDVVPLLLALTDAPPEPEDVKAGWTAFALFLLLCLAVALLGFSLVKHLRKAENARKAGIYGDEPEADEDHQDREDREGRA